MGVQNYLRIFCFSWGMFFVFVRLLGLRGQAGETEGRREGGGVFFLGKHSFPHIFEGCGAVPARFSSGKRTLPLGKRTLPWFS